MLLEMDNTYFYTLHQILFVMQKATDKQSLKMKKQNKFEIVCNYHYLVIYFPQLLPDTDTKRIGTQRTRSINHIGPRELIFLYTDYLLCW